LYRLSEIASNDADFLSQEAERALISCTLRKTNDSPATALSLATPNDPHPATTSPHAASNDSHPATASPLTASCTLRKANDPPTTALSLAAFNALHPAIAARVARLACRCVGADIRRLRYAHIAAMLGLAAVGATGSELHLPGGLRVRRSYGEMIISVAPERENNLRVRRSYGEMLISVAPNSQKSPQTPAGPPPGNVIKILHNINVEIVELINNISYNSLEQFLDADLLRADDLILRHRRDGDIFFPIKSPGTKKLKDFFIDAKIPREKRDAICLLTMGAEVVWVIGYRVSGRYCVTGNTKKVLQVLYTPGNVGDANVLYTPGGAENQPGGA